MHVHEKSTYASRVNFRTASMIHPAESDDEEEKEEDTDKAVAVKDDPQFTIAVTRGECYLKTICSSITICVYSSLITICAFSSQ